MELAIIGAGAAAVGLLDALDPAVVTSVTVFEPAAEPWRGRPYQPDLDSVLVNAPPEIMSIRFGDREHYARWLGGRAGTYTDERFGRPIPPRAVYGEYLADTARAALARFGEARVIRSAVTGVSLDERLIVRTADGRSHGADQVAVCVGGGTPLDHYGLTGAPGYVADPYPLERALADVPPGRDVAVIGGGLTAVDIVASLAARGHTGRIVLVSRSGTLPYVWQRPVETGIRHLTPERLLAPDGPTTLERLTGLIRTELAERGESWDDLAAWIAATAKRHPAESLREQLRMVDTPFSDGGSCKRRRTPPGPSRGVFSPRPTGSGSAPTTSGRSPASPRRWCPATPPSCWTCSTRARWSRSRGSRRSRPGTGSGSCTRRASAPPTS